MQIKRRIKMNKFNVLIAALMVFAAVAQVALAQQELVNEIGDETDVDDELEGGLFTSQAKKPVGISAADEWGWDVLDKNKGLKNLNEKRTPECKGSNTREACQTCCAGLDKAARFKLLGRMTSNGACTCFSRDNAYTAKLL